MRKLLTGAIALFVLISFVASRAETRSPKQDISRNLDIFTSIYKELQTAYVDSIDVNKSMRTAIDAMLNRIDPYTEYIPEDEQEDFMTISTGEYGGIGSYIGFRDGKYTYLSEPQAGSPAIKAGLKAGDRIITLDGDTMVGLDIEKVRGRLKGEAGTNVVMTVSRPYGAADGGDSIMTFTVTREKINIDPVPYYGIVRDSIGYISLTTFNEKSADQVRDALIELKKDPRLKAVLLDLRGNGGGLLESAVRIVGWFVPKGTEVLRTRGRSVINEKVYKTTNKPIDTEIPLFVAVDGGSASASEIVTGALQDLDRAVIVGNRSFGKGLVQSTRQIPYNGMLKITVAKYYIPSGRLIQAIDYSRRNPDGSVARIPDSLTNVFNTAGGRVVRDGGGITPDVTVKYPEANRLVYNIVRGLWAFDYATKYATQHDSLPAPETLEITDSMYADFKRFIDPERLQYDKVCEIVIGQLEEAAKNEGYMNDSVQAQINVLKGLLHHNLNKDLDHNRDEISGYLESELAGRYYIKDGNTRVALKADPVVDSVMSVIRETGRYKSILAPRPVSKDKK
ncbi:MAG: S41 family peptidase [Muribaculaceae bacterium]|nr:S41 family peptidase [Muribaculaceae bacterium]MDE6810527.1 S41 family peptidase [Muribaculaceae bacterium]